MSAAKRAFEKTFDRYQTLDALREIITRLDHAINCAHRTGAACNCDKREAWRLIDLLEMQVRQ